MSRGVSKHSRCVHEPIADVYGWMWSSGTSGRKLAFTDLPREWTCAKCKRRLVARWYPKEAGT